MDLKATMVWATKAYLMATAVLGIVAVLVGDHYGAFLLYALTISPIYYAVILLLYGWWKIRRRY